MFKRLFTLVLASAVLFSMGCSNKNEVNVYSARKEALIKPLLDDFTKQTGITVNLVTGKGDALLTRLTSEGKNSPADVLITIDVGRLHRAKEAGVLQPVKSDLLSQRVPAHYSDSEGHWYGLSLRSRVIVYSPEHVQENELSTYEDLANPKWRKRLCIRSSSNIYNQSLVASMLAHNGAEKTQAWLEGIVANFARSPKGGDRDQVKAIAAGQCDIAVINSYYLGAMLNGSDKKQRDTASKVALFWPNQSGRGAHMNVSGAGVTAHAKNISSAQALIEFLTSDASQKWYAKTNNEFPLRANVAISDVLKSWGPYKADSLAVDKMATLNANAVKAMDRAGWK